MKCRRYDGDGNRAKRRHSSSTLNPISGQERLTCTASWIWLARVHRKGPVKGRRSGSMPDTWNADEPLKLQSTSGRPV